jgi:hypothetical protein
VSTSKPRPQPRPKTGARDPLIGALFGKMPAQGPWPHDDREAWLNLMRASLDVVYGRAAVTDPLAPYRSPAPLHRPAIAADVGGAETVIDFRAASAAVRWYVEPDGTARAPNGIEAALEAVPIGTVLLDYRAEEDRGRLDSVIWADGTWPAGHVATRNLKIEPASKAA